MKHLMITMSVAAAMTVSVAHAGFLDNALKVAQAVQGGNSNSVLNQAANLAAQQNTQPAQVQVSTASITPYTTAQLSGMDCAALAVSAATAQREIKNLKGQADDFDKLADQADKEAAAAGNTKMVGGLLSLAGGIMGNKGKSSAEALSSLGKNLSTTQSEAALQNIDSNAIVAQYKKHEADLENIQVYERSKGCKNGVSTVAATTAVTTTATTAANTVPANANANGRYSELLQVVNCPNDSKSYGSFRDWGKWSGTSYCGQTVQSGYWVWVAPNWYIWKYQR